VRAVRVAELGVDGLMFTVEAGRQRATVQLQLMGRHNVHNALAAIAVGLHSGMSLEECAAAVGELRAGDKRGEIREWRGAKLINDSYNSNPRALDAMVDALLAIPVKGEGRHIVVAGEMLELGPDGEALHAACGRRMAERGVDVVVGVRGLAEAIVRGAAESGTDAVFVANPEEAGAWVKANVVADDAVLFKASRGVRLERALAALEDA
jgi:UDP-N-acetylmuramoyl-tripeptide--D-alanyl-D-alanine ligase